MYSWDLNVCRWLNAIITYLSQEEGPCQPTQGRRRSLGNAKATTLIGFPWKRQGGWGNDWGPAGGSHDSGFWSAGRCPSLSGTQRLVIWGNTGLGSELYKGDGWRGGLRIGWRVCSMIFASLREPDHRGGVTCDKCMPNRQIQNLKNTVKKPLAQCSQCCLRCIWTQWPCNS